MNLSKTVLVGIGLMFFSLTYAKRPFEGIRGSLFIPEYDECSSSVILNEAIISSGINVLDQDFPSSWTCEEGDTAICPKKGLICYSSVTSGQPAICFEEPEVIEVSRNYREFSGKIKVPRFKSLFVLKKSPEGYSQNTSWEMENRCHPKKAATTHKNVTINVDLKKCLERFNSLVTGGKLIKKEEHNYCTSSKVRNPEYTKNVLMDVEELARCSQLYPNFHDKFVEFLKSKK